MASTLDAPDEATVRAELGLAAPRTGARHHRAIGVVLVASTLVFALVLPFVGRKLPPSTAFVAMYQAAVVINDALTTVMLVAQLQVSRSRRVMVLGCAYCFMALMTAVHTATFPGLFAEGGLLGAGPQSTAWIYMLWHGGFFAMLLAYALMRDGEVKPAEPFAAFGLLVALVASLGWVATAGIELLPAIMAGNRYAPAYPFVIGGTWTLGLFALVALLRRPAHSVLDAWMQVVLTISLFEVALAAMLNTGRFDVGFYVGRIYGFVAASIVLYLVLYDYVGVHTHLKSTEARRQALRESERTFRTVANGIPQLAWMADEKGWIFWYNNRWYDYTGASPGDMDGWGWRKAHHPEHVDRVVDHIQRCFAKGEPWEDTFPLRGKDGAYRWFLSRALPIRDSAGKVLRWFGTNTDVTEEREAAAERERLLERERDARAEADRRREELERVTESRARLMRGFSHDLRNPLGVADAQAWLLDAGNLDARQKDAAQKIRRSIRGALRLIDDLLELTRAEAGQIEIRRVATDVPRLLRELADDFQANAAAAGQWLVVRAEEDLTAHTDPARLRQILGNLVSNAAKYASPGQVAIEARLRQPAADGARPGRWLTVSVVDSGPGIPADKAESVFEEFTRLDPGAPHGSGIGLAISRRIARLLGGDLALEKPGTGNGCFTVWLPLEA